MTKSYADWLQITKSLYGEYSNLKEAHEVEVAGKKFIVLPKVFSPKYHANTSYFAQYIPNIVGGRQFLEIGTGAGVIALLCALNGAKVVATDINPSAVENCRLNAEYHHVTLDVRLGDVFGPIKPHETFDYIFWNHPWNYSDEPESDILLQAGIDYKYQGLKRFLEDGKNYLASGGKILLGTGGFARLNLIESLAEKEQYEYKILHRQEYSLEAQGNNITEFLIYEFTPMRSRDA